MNASDLTDLTDSQVRALAVLVAARSRPERRPVRASNRTTKPAEFDHREMLLIHRKTAATLVDAGLVCVTNDVLLTLELTDAGRQVLAEAGLA